MSENYVECLVARKPSYVMNFLKMLLIMLTVGLVLVGFVLMPGIPGLLLAAVAAVGAYFANLYASVEYEYLYVDREISVDKVLAKSKRKKAGNYTLEQMEIMAPVGSHRLDSYQNRQVKVVDYSSGVAQQPEKRYMMVMNDCKVILEPNEGMLKAIQDVAPRKVFRD